MKEDRFAMRMSKVILQKLEDLCDKYERSKTAQIEELIRKEWDKNFENDEN